MMKQWKICRIDWSEVILWLLIPIILVVVWELSMFYGEQHRAENICISKPLEQPNMTVSKIGSETYMVTDLTTGKQYIAKEQ